MSGLPRRRAALAGVAALVLAGCGAPEFQYAAEQPGSVPAGTVYFKVPQGWTQFPAASIAAAEKQWSGGGDPGLIVSATAWQEAYDAAADPSLDHVLGRTTPDHPVVYASLRSLYTEEQAGATRDALRDMLVPVSTAGSGVTIRTDQDVAQGGAQGVHLVFSYAPSPGQPEETIDQTAYLSDGTDAVYLLVVRCTSTCYDQNQDAIEAVTSSYTIQEAGHG